jgi:hypothetical protein
MVALNFSHDPLRQSRGSWTRLSCLHICNHKVCGFIPQTPSLFRCLDWQTGGHDTCFLTVRAAGITEKGLIGFKLGS